MEDTLAAVAYQHPLPGDYYRLGLHTGWKGFVPGQFGMLQVPPAPGVLLRRPFSLARQIGPVTEILYKAVGKGTQALAQVRQGQSLRVLGPLGQGFSEIPLGNDAGKNIVGVAGGYGIAPFWELAAQLRERSQTLKLFYGARSSSDLIYLEQLESLGVELHLTTEDGSRGHRGLVTELLNQQFGREKPSWVGGCGPMGLLYALGRWCEDRGVSAQLSVEEAMGCGTGVCLGCVVKDRQGHYRRACVEGPVMSSQMMEIPA
jgi:dihydroorotate dehydrogenase electron transfer subunit